MKRDFDPITLEVCWNRLISIANEQAATMVNSAFSAVLGEMEDLSAGIFDRSGTMIAQCVQGAPGHLGTLGAGMKHFVRAFPPQALKPGDVLITNDPWLVSGHKHDITVVTPVFRGRSLVGFTASNCHTVDVGGRIFSAEAAEVYEEGLNIPMMKLYSGGRPNSELLHLIRTNVRSPDLVLGDLMAQVSANQVAGEKLVAFMADEKLPDLEALTATIVGRTERIMRAAIAKLPDGTYADSVELDGFGTPLTIAAELSVKGSRMTIDFAGTSPQIAKGVNCVLNYTKAFANYAIKCALCPDAPNNDGSFRPIQVTAPAGSIVNATYPAPVGGRHLVGLFIPFAIFGALAPVIPEHVVADSSVVGAVTFSGRWQGDRPYVFTFFCHGGMGGRADKDGLDATAFPSNVANVPMEVMEQSIPLVVTRKELIKGSGGAGKFNGGKGQRISVKLRENTEPANVSLMFERANSSPRGMLGGLPGRTTRLTIDGKVIHPKQTSVLKPGQDLVIETSGGGGYGKATKHAMSPKSGKKACRHS